MSYEPFPIADLEFGAYEGKEPWISPQSAWRELKNVRIFRGRAFKRQGFKHFSTLGTELTQEDLGDTGAGPTPATIGNWPSLPTVSNASKITNKPILPKEPSPSLYNINLNIPPYYFRIDVFASGTIWNLESWDGGVAAQIASISAAQINVANGEWYVTLSSVGSFDALADIKIDYEYNRKLPVVGIHGFVDAAGSKQVVALDTRRLWKLNGAEERFEETNPAAAGVTDVTGSDTWSGLEQHLMDFTVMQNVLVMNNRKDKPMLWDPVGGLREQKTDLTTPGGIDKDIASAYATLQFKQRLVHFRTTEGGNDKQRRVRWPRVDQLETFDGLDSADVPSESHIQHVRLIGDKCIIFCDKKAEVFELVGDPDPLAPFSFRRLRGEGDSLSRFGGVSVIDEAIIWGRTSLLRCDGNEALAFKAGEIPDFVLKADPEAAAFVYGAELEPLHEAWLAYAASGQSFPTEILAINTLTLACFVHEFPAHCFGEMSAGTDLTWDTAPGTWDTSEFAWDEGGLSAGFPIPLAGDRESRVYQPVSGQYFDHTLDGNEQPQESLFRLTMLSQRLNPLVDGRRGAMRKVRLGKLDIIADANPGVQLTVKISAGYVAAPYLTETIDLTPDAPGEEKVIRRIPVGRQAPFHQILIENLSISRIAIDAVVPWFDVSGRFRRT